MGAHGGVLTQISPSADSFELAVTYTNKTGETARIHAWVDWNDDGRFGPSDYAWADVRSDAGAQTETLAWGNDNGLGGLTTAGRRHIRLRIITDSNLNGIETGDTDLDGYDIRSLGVVFAGEIEDHEIHVLDASTVVESVGKINAVGINLRNGFDDGAQHGGTVPIDVMANDETVGGGELDPDSVRPVDPDGKTEKGGQVACEAVGVSTRPPTASQTRVRFEYEICLIEPTEPVYKKARMKIKVVAPTLIPVPTFVWRGLLLLAVGYSQHWRRGQA